MSYQGYPLSCQLFSYGEVEDYTLKLGGGGSQTQAAFGYLSDGLTVKFTDKSQAPGTSIEEWLWDFGDGGQSDRPSPTHEFSAAGTYTVKLTVTDAKGASDAETKSITVLDEEPEYCESGGSDQEYEWIAAVTLGVHSKTSGASAYSDFTSEAIEAAKGQTLSVKLKAGYGGSSYAESWRVWADLNRDGDFDDAGEMLLEKSGTGEITGTIGIPATAAGGPTRLRVSMSYGSFPKSCGSFSYGETEDYTLNIP
jgi:PKD repeat protein